MRNYHKADRVYLGVSNEILNTLTKEWRSKLTIQERVDLAKALWDMNIHETRIAAAKLLTQARIADDAEVWALIYSWVPQFDAWAIADHACTAGQKRLMADLDRLDTAEGWTVSPEMWSRRAALVITLPLAKLANPKPHEIAARERVLVWASQYTTDREWFIQKAIGWWLRTLSKHDPERVEAFLEANGSKMKAFARKEARKHMKS